MISSNSESTASCKSSPQDATQKLYEDDPRVADKRTEDALLSTLKSSELLKHLLNTAGRKVQKEDESGETYGSRRGGDSPRGSSTQSVTQSFLPGKIRSQTVTQVALTYKTKIEVSNAIASGDVLSSASTVTRVTDASPSDKNDIMDEKCELKQSDYPSPTSCHLHHNEVQLPLTEHSEVQNDDLPILPRELLENETMDYILAEAQRSLNLQSPCSSHFSPESDSSEILAGPSTSYGYGSFQTPSPQTNSSYSPSYPCPTGNVKQAEGSDLKSSSDNESSKGISSANASEEDSSDSDLDSAMVLVPSGNFFHFLSNLVKVK